MYGLFKKQSSFNLSETMVTENKENRREDIETIKSGIEYLHLIDHIYKPSAILMNLNINGGLEDDDPFAGIGDDPVDQTAMDNTFNDMNSEDPFAGDLGGGDMGLGVDGMDDSMNMDVDSGEPTNTGGRIEVSRKELLKQSMDLPSNIRKIFPPRFKKLQEVIKKNIKAIERLSVLSTDEIVMYLLGGYNDQYRLIEDFLSVISEKTYDQIFMTYVEIHTNCMKLKDVYTNFYDKINKSSN